MIEPDYGTPGCRCRALGSDGFQWHWEEVPECPHHGITTEVRVREDEI